MSQQAFCPQKVIEPMMLTRCRLASEGKLLRQFQHPCLNRVHQVFKDDKNDRVYLMQKEDGTTVLVGLGLLMTCDLVPLGDADRNHYQAPEQFGASIDARADIREDYCSRNVAQCGAPFLIGRAVLGRALARGRAPCTRVRSLFCFGSRVRSLLLDLGPGRLLKILCQSRYPKSPSLLSP